jgi:TPR repeat protein
MLQSGSGVSRDLAKAETFMERAANGGLPPAEFDLSRMLDLGLGVAADKKRADLLLNSAAKQGEPRAQERLRQLQPPAGHPVS